MPQREDGDQSFTKAPPNPYIKVSQHTKDKLAYMVMIENYKVSSAAKILKIHQSTAKMTMRTFKVYSKEKQQQILRSGAIKKKDKMKRKDVGQAKIKEGSQQNNKSLNVGNKNQQQERESQIKDEVKEQILYKNQDQNKNKTQQQDTEPFFFVYVPYFYPLEFIMNPRVE